MKKSEEQFQRMRRWYSLFREISDGKTHDRDSEYYKDVVYTFFQNCWHLKDWIKNSGELEPDKVKKIENFFHTNTDFKICRDMANGSKHSLNTNPSIDPKTSISRSQYSLSLGGGIPHIKVVYWIHVDGYPAIDAMSLADSLVAHCEAVMKTYGLLN